MDLYAGRPGSHAHGIGLFIGTIYITALGAPAALGIMTPFGGLSLTLALLLVIAI
jgi:uncharacterized membrane protein YgdD (TMEM256/DUF423 family)